MEMKEFIEYCREGNPIRSTEKEKGALLFQCSQEAMKITNKLNNKYNTSDEVRKLFEELTGREIDSSFMCFPPFYTDFGKNIIGAKIVSYNRLAKYIVINLSNNNSIIWHLGMSGRIKICESIPEALEKHDHVLIITDNGVLIYNDPRRFGMITYCKTQDIPQLDFVKRIGLDAFSSDLTPAYLKEKFKIAYLYW